MRAGPYWEKAVEIMQMDDPTTLTKEQLLEYVVALVWTLKYAAHEITTLQREGS